MQYINDYSPTLYEHIMKLKEEKAKTGYVNLVRAQNKHPQDRRFMPEDLKAKVMAHACQYAGISVEEARAKIDYFYATRAENKREHCKTQEEQDAIWEKKSDIFPFFNVHCQFAYYNSIYDAIVKKLENEKQLSICDFGCSTGAFALVLNKVLDTKAVTLMDLDNERHKFIDYIVEQEQEKNIHFADILKEHKEQYDLVICFDVLEHLEHSFEGLERLNSLVKPNGFLALKVAFEVDSFGHMPKAAENFFVDHDGLAYLNEHFIPIQDFPEKKQLVCTLYQKKT